MYAIELVVKLKWLALRGRNNPKNCDLIIEAEIERRGFPTKQTIHPRNRPRLSPSEMAREDPVGTRG
jgi:hypothetical protein